MKYFVQRACEKNCESSEFPVTFWQWRVTKIWVSRTNQLNFQIYENNGEKMFRNAQFDKKYNRNLSRRMKKNRPRATKLHSLTSVRAENQFKASKSTQSLLKVYSTLQSKCCWVIQTLKYLVKKNWYYFKRRMRTY